MADNGNLTNSNAAYEGQLKTSMLFSKNQLHHIIDVIYPSFLANKILSPDVPRAL